MYFERKEKLKKPLILTVNDNNNRLKKGHPSLRLNYNYNFKLLCFEYTNEFYFVYVSFLCTTVKTQFSAQKIKFWCRH